LILLTLTTYSMGQVGTTSNRGDIDKKKEKRIKVFTKWIRKNNIKIGKLPQANPDELIYDCDSIPMLKQINGDTLIFWLLTSSYTTGGFYLRRDKKELNKLIKKESFGRTDYVEKIDDQGNIVLASLTSTKFKIRNDSLFKLRSFFRISQDSIDKAVDKYFQEKRFDLARELIFKNHYLKFVLIFHATMFSEKRVYEGKEVGDRIALDHIWKVGEKKYYQITFITESHGRIIKFPTYLFDDKFRFIQYDGCNKSEMDQLTKEMEIDVKD
jgi:hypothetical protein